MLLTRKSAYAEGTIVNFKTQWTAYLLFCNYFEVNPFMVSVDFLCAYAQFLSRTFKSVQSIRNYLNGVRTLFLLHGQDIDFFSSFEIKLTLKGLERKLKHLPRQALPISLDILEKIYQLLDITSPLDAVFWCLFLFAFF